MEYFSHIRYKMTLSRWSCLAPLGLWPPGLQLERPWRKVGIFLLPLALPSSLTLPFLTFFPTACPSSCAPCSFHWCLCLPEESMAHRHRNRQPWQVEIAGSAAMHDTPCDRGMPTLWNQNEHCALTPSLSACTGFYTQFSRAHHAGAPCLICILHMQLKPLFHSQAGQSGQRSLADLKIASLETRQDIFHVTQRRIEMVSHDCRHVCSCISRTHTRHVPLIKTTHALQCHYWTNR